MSPLVVIVGPTASGKSLLAMELARQFDGEIICADSRTVYRGMDKGTAKPNKEEQTEILHHLLDIITPDKPFNAAQFKQMTLMAVNSISGRGKLPIMVGGTGLYIDSVIFDFAFLPAVPQEEREALQALSIKQLQEKLRQQGIPLPENSRNPRHLMRALETNGAVAVKKGLRPATLVLGLDSSKQELEDKIKQRVLQMIENGLQAEAIHLAQKYGWDAPGLSAVGYREWQNTVSAEDALQMIIHDTMQYAKRQRTWFKRNSHIVWVKNSAEAEALVRNFLQKTTLN